jgi:hypothetical protein
MLASVFAWIGQASAGWIIDEVVKGRGEDSRQQVMLQANRMKSLTFGKGGRAVAAFILDLNSETITQVDYEERHYVTAPIQEYVQTIRSAMTGAMKQIEDALKDVPPEQRKMAEQLMRSQIGQSGLAAQECREPRMELRKSGQQATIAGYPAVRYDVLADGKLGSELWIAKGIPAWRELDPQKLERFAAEMARLAGCGPSRGPKGPPGVDPSWKLVSEGYPVRTVDRGGSGGTLEVVKAEGRTLSAAEFQPPPGFRRKTLREMTEK